MTLPLSARGGYSMGADRAESLLCASARGLLYRLADAEENAYAVTASSSLSPAAVGSNMEGNSHFSRTKIEPRFVPWCDR